VTSTERIFVNFPRWRKGVENSVVEITKDNQKSAYPNEEWNGKLVAQLKIKIYWCSICGCFENKLYVLDTRSPLFAV
jgi:hypothetical protein